jgi:hypothetical protein
MVVNAKHWAERCIANLIFEQYIRI